MLIAINFYLIRNNQKEIERRPKQILQEHKCPCVTLKHRSNSHSEVANDTAMCWGSKSYNKCYPVIRSTNDTKLEDYNVEVSKICIKPTECLHVEETTITKVEEV